MKVIDVRYASEFGWLMVRDCFSGEWHKVQSKDCPPIWRKWAYEQKHGGSSDSSTRPRVERRPDRPGETD